MPKMSPLDEPSEYEKIRDQNIASNQGLLLELMKQEDVEVEAGVAVAISMLGIAPAPATKSKKKSTKTKKQVVKKDQDEDDENIPPREMAGTRRSARHAGKPTVSYAGDGEHIIDRSKMPRIVSRPDQRWDEDASDYEDSDDEDEDEDEDEEGKRVRRIRRTEPTGKPNRLVGRKHDPKQFGTIPGVPIGSWWETRAECSSAAIHAPFVAGISGGTEGAYSVALSGGYDDDVDLGEAFTYTGSGGRDLKGTKDKPKNLRTAPQSSDQTFDNSFNQALKVSSETRKPVRVIRGFKLPSKYAPKTGYRYDGLYVVEKAWIEPGNNPGRFKVCKFAFRRLPGQPAIPERTMDTDDEDEDEIKEEEEEEGTEKSGDEKVDVKIEEAEEEEVSDDPPAKRAKIKSEEEEPAPAPVKKRGRPPKKRA